MTARMGHYGLLLQQAATPAVGCAYPLDAPEAEVLTLGFVGRLTMSADEQEGSYVYRGGLAATETMAAFPTGLGATPSVATLDFSTGATAIEFQIPAFPAVETPTSGYVSATLVLTNPDASATYSAFVETNANNGGNFSIKADNGTSELIIAQGLAAPPASLGFVSDGTNIYVRYNGVNYHPGPLPAIQLVAFIRVSESAALAAVDVGKTVTIRAETNAANFIGAYEVGTTDPCGNAIA